MSHPDAWTIKRLLTWTTDYLKQRGSETPRLDAEILLAEAIGCDRIELYTSFEEEPGEAARDRFRGSVKRRAAGEPVAYIVGKKEFYSLTFSVNRHVLIPRPETELLVVESLDFLKTLSLEKAPVFGCDVGTGSGAIAVALLRHAPKLQMTAIDRSGETLEVARKNAIEHDVAGRVEWREGDLMGDMAEEPTFHLIVSNPPYVSRREYQELPAEVKEYEPKTALEAGPTGTELIERLLPQALPRLFPGGALLVEISPMIADRVVRLFEHQRGFEEIQVVKDLSQRPRVVRARRRS